MKRAWILSAAALGMIALGLSAALPTRPVAFWNPTSSAPEGLWRRLPGAPSGGDWALVRPSPPIAAWLAARGYLPLGVPLIKHVAAQSGQVVCRRGESIQIDGRRVAMAKPRDSLGRPLPAWCGCRRLGAGELFLLNPHPDSLDGRYLGVTAAPDVLGRAKLVWRR